MNRLLFTVALAIAATGSALASTAHLLILHTNDLHDHVRPGYGGHGGLPYVAGYINQVRAGRKDVLVLDAGDDTEKGDMVAYKSGESLMFELMRRIGYDAVTPGNHDEDAGRDGLRRYEKILGQPLLNLNLLRADGTPEFTPSRIVEVGGVRVGIIGLIVPRKEHCLNFEESGRALAREAVRLKRDAQLVIALCHEGSRNCAAWAKLAPAVDVFVSGHTHEALVKPGVAPETGAVIVQAGYYAEWVGRLELDVDLDAKKVIHSSGLLVPMRHDSVPVDQAMVELVRARERELCPEATEIVSQSAAAIPMNGVAVLAADALRRSAGVDIGFCHPGQIIRAPLPAGPIDINALFLTGGQRGDATVLAELSGAEIAAYLTALGGPPDRDQTVWSGFGAPGELQPEHRYRIVMPELEWTTRFLREAKRAVERKTAAPLGQREFSARPSAVTFIGAMTARAKELTAAKMTLSDEAARLTAEIGAR
jgi:2',3'-cyclic-nucleotide 2'-phosphodiesterase (5'-nucleotidase family)